MSKICKKIYIRRKIKQYEESLVEQGMAEAHSRGKNIQIGLEAKAVINEDPFQNIYLPQTGKGVLDISPLILLGGEVDGDSLKKYISYNRLLRRVH